MPVKSPIQNAVRILPISARAEHALVGGSVICVKSAQGFGYVPTAKFYLGVFWPLTLVSLVLKNCNMHPYGQYCPVARAAEILADRWTLLIVRDLLADVRHFNELERGLPHMSRTLLAERLRRLEQMRVLERRATSRGRPTEYRLTAAGRELQQIIDQFGEWGARWAFGPPRPNELDPIILLMVDAPAGRCGSHFPSPGGDTVRLSARTAAKLLAAD